MFFRFVCMGKAMIDYAERGDLDNFSRLLFESEDKELMFWHVSKGFKSAVKNRHLNIIRFIIEDLEMSLDHEAFQKYLHLFLFSCQEAEIEEDQEGMQTNREVLKLLVKGKGPNAIDECDNVNSSTPLMAACENLTDIEIIKILISGGADINSVNSDDKMPLSIIKERLDKQPDNEKIKEIYEYLKSKGAVLNWKSLPKLE